MDEDMTSSCRLCGEARRADTTTLGLAEAWGLLTHPITVFPEHVDAFQRAVETTLSLDR